MMGSSIVSDPKHYRLVIWTISFDRFLYVELYFSMILILLMGPNLISQDLRFNAMPLYLSRPLRRIDYFLGKLGIIAALIGMVVVVPSIVAYLLGLLLSLDFTIVRDTFSLLAACILYGVILAFSAGLLILAMSALSRNSRYVALFWIGLLLLGFALWQALDGLAAAQREHAYNVAHRADFQNLQLGPRGRGDRRRQERMWFEQRDRRQEILEAQEFDAARSDWRPLLSYMANITRVRESLLNSNAQWEKFGAIQPGGVTPSFRLAHFNPSYPWYWSAIVLLCLFGLSTWILNAKVKSLDRLK
jgi:ABC-2 type transport system permease protein